MVLPQDFVQALNLFPQSTVATLGFTLNEFDWMGIYSLHIQNKIFKGHICCILVVLSVEIRKIKTGTFLQICLNLNTEKEDLLKKVFFKAPKSDTLNLFSKKKYVE